MFWFLIEICAFWRIALFLSAAFRGDSGSKSQNACVTILCGPQRCFHYLLTSQVSSVGSYINNVIYSLRTSDYFIHHCFRSSVRDFHQSLLVETLSATLTGSHVTSRLLLFSRIIHLCRSVEAGNCLMYTWRDIGIGSFLVNSHSFYHPTSCISLGRYLPC